MIIIFRKVLGEKIVRLYYRKTKRKDYSMHIKKHLSFTALREELSKQLLE